MSARFRWITFDVNDLLPPHWQQEITTVAAEADFREFPKTPVLTRESAEVSHINRGRVHAHQVRRGIPWLQDLYHGSFLELANDAWPESVVPAADARYGVVLNVQRGTSMRFEAHVDSNPVSGVLFCSDHPAGGGEVAISHDPAAADVDAIERNCSVIRPQAGYLVFFDGRDRAHYARSLMAESDMRVVAVMNFYTESFPESTRPRELNRHLYGEPGLPGYARHIRVRRNAHGQAALPVRAAVLAIVPLPRTVSPI
jgi:hypothetical protein